MSQQMSFGDGFIDVSPYGGGETGESGRLPCCFDEKSNRLGKKAVEGF
jgi:hypothetical protein